MTTTSINKISDTAPGGMSKRERYKWTTVDRPGEFATIDKNKLQIDEQYQRRHKGEKIKRMAAEWSWIACGAISIALRDDGEWFVMDGQHRVLAARLRDDIQGLPCMIFDIDTVADEARGFIASNANRKPMTAVDKFKALLMTEDHAARVVNELVLRSGRHVSVGSAASVFGAVHVMLQYVVEDETTIRRIWPVITELCGPDNRILQSLIIGMFYLERHLDPTESSLASTRWRKRIVQIGYDAVNKSIAQSAAFYGSGGAKPCALGIAQVINKGLRNPLAHTIKLSETDV